MGAAIMKKFLFILLAITLVIPFTFLLVPVQSSIADTASDMSTFDAYNLLKEFIDGDEASLIAPNHSRTAGTEGEALAATYLENKLTSFGYGSDELAQVKAQSFLLDDLEGIVHNYTEQTSSNIIAELKFVNNTKQVIIGAHYDNAYSLYYGTSTTLSSGAFDNGTGVAVLLDLAKRFYDYKYVLNEMLPFNVTFVFFGAEEIGLMGSGYFVSKMSETEKKNTLMMINLDVIAGGKNLYVYGEDIKNPQEDYFSNISKQHSQSGNIQKMPANMGTIVGLSVSGSRPYMHTGHQSDNLSFMDAGIPIAFFFSGNLKSDYFGYVENEQVAGQIMHTKNDTIQSLMDITGGKFVTDMTLVSNTVFAGLIDNGFVSMAGEAAKSVLAPFWLSTLYPYLFFVVLFSVAAFLAYLYYKSLKRKAALGFAEFKDYKNDYKSNSKTSADEIFKF